jgi:hypothetical protein
MVSIIHREPLYNTWALINQRCNNPNNIHYPNYGGRGITMCEEWKDDFFQFKLDMGDRPEGYSIDRIDNNKGYYKDNCRWADRTIQANNQREKKNLRKVSINNREYTLRELSEEYDINIRLLTNRYGRGYRGEELIKPLDNRGRWKR